MSVLIPAEDLMSRPSPAAVLTTAAQDDALAVFQKSYRQWQSIIDDSLVEWGRSPEGLAEIDLIPPTTAAIQVACKLAMWFRDRNLPAPTRTMPDGDGGLVFERRMGSQVESIEIDSEGLAEYVLVRSGSVVMRRR